MSLINAEAEQSVIGGCLMGYVVDDLDDLSADDFAVQSHREAFALIRKSWVKGVALDPFSLHDALPVESVAGREGVGYWSELAAGAVGSLTVLRARVVRASAVRRRVMEVAEQMAAAAQGQNDIAECINEASAAIAQLAQAQDSRGPKLIGDILTAHMAVIDARMRGEASGLATGFADLDRLARLRPGNVAVLAARPAMGKTAFALQVARHVARSGAVYVSSQEMSDAELADRMLSAGAKLPLESVIAGKLDTEQRVSLELASNRLSGAPLYIDDGAGQSLAQIRSKARAIHRNTPLKLIVIDYLQLMNGNGENRNAEIQAISRGVKNLAKEFGVPVLLLSQLNRELEKRPNRRPLLSDLRESGAIEQDADIVMFIYRDEVYHPNSPDAGTAEIIVAKNRQGPTGLTRLTWLGPLTAFGDCDYRFARSAPTRVEQHK